MFRIHPTLFDICAILLAVFMLVSVLMAKNIEQEYLTEVNMLKRAADSRHTSGSDIETLYLTVIPINSKEYRFIISSKKLGKKVFHDVSGVRDELSSIRPSRVALRIDRNVPTGLTQRLIIISQSLGILPYLSVEKG